ncbi:MAG: mechanosensitive ion channel [Sphingomonadaceae bacterium]|nr:mechanosensitive ion channel [Sphingomonadaceae bacterium]
MALPKVKTSTATPSPPGPGISESLGNAHAQLHLLARQSVEWVVHNSLQIVVSAVIGTAITLALLGIRTLGTRLCREGRGGHWRLIIGRMFAKTSFWFCVIVAVRLVDGYADAPPAVDRTINFFFTVITVFQAAVWTREFVLGLIEHRAGADENDVSGLGSAIGIIRLLVSLALFAIAAVLVLDNLGVNVTGLIAGLGIGGIAIGLAAQGIFADLFAALAIIFDRPFRRGDSISWSGTSGNVEAIGLKSTRVRALSGELVVIANRKLLDQEIHNFARLDRRRNTVDFAIDYQTPPEIVARIPDVVKGIVTQHPKCVLVRCGLIGFGVGGILIEVVFDVRSENYNEVFGARSAVSAEIVAALGAEKVAFVNSQPK